MNAPRSGTLIRSAKRPLALLAAAAVVLSGLAAVETSNAPAAEAAVTTYTHPDGATITYNNEVVAGEPIKLSGTNWKAVAGHPDLLEGDEGSIIGVKMFPGGNDNPQPNDAGTERICKIANPWNGDTDYVNIGVWDIIQAAGTGDWWTGDFGSFDVSVPWPTAWTGSGAYQCGNAGEDLQKQRGYAKNPEGMDLKPGDTFSLQFLSGTMYGNQQCSGGNCNRPDVSRTIKLDFTVVAPSTPAPINFIDVPKSHKFYKQIQWMAQNKITTGTKTPKGLAYEPKKATTREAMAAFLYRMYADDDYVAPAKSPFVDVPKSHKFYKQIAWMAEEGISTGTKQKNGTVKYEPKVSTSREAMAAFLYRAENVKGFKAPTKSPFIDVKKSDKFYTQITWMHAEGISTGTSTPKGKVYEPKVSTSREAMSAFLYRIAN